MVKSVIRKTKQDKFVYQMNMRLAYMARNQNLFTTVLKKLVSKGILNETDLEECIKEAAAVSQQNPTPAVAAAEPGRPETESGDQGVAGHGEPGLLLAEGDRATELSTTEPESGGELDR